MLPPVAVPFKPRSPLCETHGEELASMITHAIGALLSVAALVVMVVVSLGDPYRVVSASIFGGTLVLLYGASTVYHSFSTPRLKSFLQILDHACIYLLIAGSYTPLTLVTMRGPWGWSLFGIVWSLAVAGVILKATTRGKRETVLSTVLYLAMGWLVVIALGPLVRSLPPAGLAWLVAGGVCYTLGVGFFAWGRLRYNHAIWHLFVIAGSACHVVTAIGFILR